MRRRRALQVGLAPSLFPFLAVLICTMGALIALLVLGVQQAHVHADMVSEKQHELTQRRQQENKEKRMQREDLLWQQDLLEQHRTEKTAQLAERRLQLSHLEDHVRQLQGDWQRLQQKIHDLQQLKQQRQGKSQDWQAQLQQLTEQIEEAQKQLKAMRQQSDQESRGYAIVVYDGAQGTKRRPVYLECTNSGISIQPGDVQISCDDLAGPGGPGNPLDACLRTIREYLVQQGVTQEDPYPLLLVRPDAVYTYALAREAMKSWEDEFGYELIEETVTLEFSPADENLKALLIQTIRDARERQISLTRAMPSRFSGHASGQYRPGNQRGRPESPVNPSTSRSGRGLGQGVFGGAGRDSGHESGISAAEKDFQTGRLAGNQAGSTNRSTEDAGLSAADGGAAIAPGKRQAGWGLPKQQPGVTAVSRPVRVICTTDRLIIVPGRYERLAPFTTQTHGQITESLDNFVAALWKYMENWGIAVAGGYWKPILHVEVRPGAESHFETLKTLLKSSGIEVRRK